jgi:AraC-like DNA-binding protein
MKSVSMDRRDDHIPTQRFAVSVDDLQAMASAARQGMIADLLPTGGYKVIEPTADVHRELVRYGTQEILDLSDDLILIRTDMHSFPLRTRWEMAMRGWLYLHFRLDGLSDEETPDGRRVTIEGERFFLSAFAHERPFARELLDGTWRTVGIFCRPSFAIRYFEISAETLPEALRRFHGGDANVDFWHAGQLTSAMKSAVKALLYPSVHGGLRTTYLRAKIVELVCLTLERLRHEERVEGALRLSQRDLQCLRDVRRLLHDRNPAPSLERIAREVGINRTKLALGFKQVFGVTVGEYHRELRLGLARETLEKQPVPVALVASAAGYCDPGSFSKAFRARYGCLPSQVRPEICGPPELRKK